jgi:hypothetical protein
MSFIDKTIYQFINDNISIQTLEKNFTPTTAEIEFAIDNTRNPKTTLCFLITLKIFQYAGYFVKVFNCPTKILNHITEISKSESLDEDNMHAYDMSRQSSRHKEIILEYSKVKPYDKQTTIKIAKNIAKSKDVQVDIINCIIEELLRKQYELPTFDELETIAQHARISVNNHYYKIICDNLTPKQIRTIRNKILIRNSDGKSLWNLLKNEPEKPTIKTLHDFVQHYSWLKSIDIDRKIFKDVPMVKLDRFYQEAVSLNLFRIKRMKKLKRVALIAVTIRKVSARTLDDLGSMLIKIMRETEVLAKHKLLLFKADQFEFTDELINAFKNILEAYKNEKSSKEKFNAISTLIADNLDYFLEKCEGYEAYSKKDYLPFMLQRYNYLRKDLLLCLAILQLSSLSKDKNIEKAVKLVLNHANNNLDTISVKEFKSNQLELSWLPRKWRKFIMQDQNNILRAYSKSFIVC